MLRKIIHIDMDAFFAAIEERDHPELHHVPMAVGHAEKRGVIATANYVARKYGVHSALSSVKAMSLCPQLVILPGRMDLYQKVSLQIRQIFLDYTDLIEPLSIDEASCKEACKKAKNEEVCKGCGNPKSKCTCESKCESYVEDLALAEACGGNGKKESCETCTKKEGCTKEACKKAKAEACG